MPITIGINISSLKAQRQLTNSSSALNSVFERLSSGQRINKASDDAAGLAIANSLNVSGRVFNQGVRNFNDGISLLNIADGSLQQLSNITVRLKELAEQSANGTFGVSQRKSMDAEAQALAKEFFRIERSTSFNGRGLFFSEFGKLTLQGGFGTDGGIQSGLGGAIGNGTLAAATSYTAESTSSAGLVLGDLNGDGILDMITVGSSGGAGTATVRLGAGDGTFGAATTYAEETTTNAVTLGDVNGDGILDLVTAGTTGSGKATVRIGVGDGTFGAATSYAAESTSTSAVTLGDVNGDGILDLVMAGNSGGSGKADIRLGNGDGTFGAATSIATTLTSSLNVALGDLNGDGILDLVTTGSTGSAVINLGNGNGTFGTGTSYLTGVGATRGLSLGDINGDGILDLAASGDNGAQGVVSIRLGVGDGTFGSSTTYLSESNRTYAVKFSDINGDGFLDLISAGDTGAVGKTTVRLGVGDGTFGTAVSYATQGTSSRALALGDINGDGVLDVVTAGITSGAGGATTLLSNTVDGVSPLLSFSLTSRANALQALSQFDQALNRINTQRGIVGAFQSRLAVATGVLQVTSENYKAAESRIRDADVAAESSELIRLKILQQAGTAILAQANQQPALALKLLS